MKYSRHLQKLLVNQFQSIHALLKLNILIRQLSLVLYLAKLLLQHLLRAGSKRRKIGTSSQRNAGYQSMSAGDFL